MTRERPMSARGAYWGALVLLCLGPLLAGCELTEVTIVETRDVVVVEGLVQVFSAGVQPVVSVFLHRTLDDSSRAGTVPGAVVRVAVPAKGFDLDLPEVSVPVCAVRIPDDVLGSCYSSLGSPIGAADIGTGDVVELHISLPGGGTARSVTRVPGAFDLVSVQTNEDCFVRPNETFEIVWTVSPDSWAYISETSITGIRAALQPLGIEVEDDPLHLLGLSVSANDTTLVYPAEVGVFARTDLNQDLAVALQGGLPSGTTAEVAVTAVDRNFVNWGRGGNFNPSGPVRVPSIVGDATGFFGSSVVRPFSVEVADGQTTCGVLP